MIFDAVFWLTFGNVFLFLASIPMLWDIYKNRSKLRGYPWFGTTVMFLGVTCFTIFYIVQINVVWISFILNFPNLVMWSVATISVWRMKFSSTRYQYRIGSPGRYVTVEVFGEKERLKFLTENPDAVQEYPRREKK